MFKWLSLITGFFYIVLGVVVIVYKFFLVVLEPKVSYLLGGLLIAYGIFRMVRTIIRIKSDNY